MAHAIHSACLSDSPGLTYCEEARARTAITVTGGAVAACGHGGRSARGRRQGRRRRRIDIPTLAGVAVDLVKS